MFARFTRLPLKRAIHTASGAARSAPRLGRTSQVVLGATAGATAYVMWDLSSAKSKIHLDSVSKPSAPKPATPTPASSSQPTPPPPSTPEPTPTPSSSPPKTSTESPEGTSAELGSTPEAPEAGSSSGGGGGGAYNPETGEINWDCPCLGGMAEGPCGEDFKAAFSCFIFSEEEPKGINCVGAFKKMQDCFREHPEHYADEIMDDDDDEPAASPAGEEGSTGEAIPDAATPDDVEKPFVPDQPESEPTESPTPSSTL